MASIVDLNLQDVPDLEPVERGEYDVEVLKATARFSQKGNPIVVNMLGINNEDTFPAVHNLNVPYKGCEYVDSFKRQLKEFCDAFNIAPEDFETQLKDAFDQLEDGDVEGVEIAGLKGLTGRASIVPGEYEGRPTNNIKRLL